jgi:hypothetical protein
MKNKYMAKMKEIRMSVKKRLRYAIMGCNELPIKTWGIFPKNMNGVFPM